MPDWKFLIKHLGPAVKTAWVRDVGLPDTDFVMGYTGTKNPKRKGEVMLRGRADNRHMIPSCDFKDPAFRSFTYDIVAKRWTEDPK